MPPLGTSAVISLSGKRHILYVIRQTLWPPGAGIVSLEAIWERLQPLVHAIDIRLGLVWRKNSFQHYKSIFNQRISPVSEGIVHGDCWLVLKVRHGGVSGKLAKMQVGEVLFWLNYRCKAFVLKCSNDSAEAEKV